MIRTRTVPSCFPSCTSPVSDSDYVRFSFLRCIQWGEPWSFKISGAVIHHFSFCTQLRKLFNCNCVEPVLTAFGGVYLPFFFSSGLLISVGMSGSIWEKTAAVCLPEFILQSCSLKQFPCERSFEIFLLSGTVSAETRSSEKTDRWASRHLFLKYFMWLL